MMKMIYTCPACQTVVGVSEPKPICRGDNVLRHFCNCPSCDASFELYLPLTRAERRESRKTKRLHD